MRDETPDGVPAAGTPETVPDDGIDVDQNVHAAMA